MTITVDIRPEVEAELVRQGSRSLRAIEVHAATLLEDAVHLQAGRSSGAHRSIIDRCLRKGQRLAHG